MQRKLVILDIDETLLHSSETRLGLPEDFRAWDYFVYKRPYLDEFLHFVATHFDVVVWTSGGATYAQILVSQLFPDVSQLRFVWSAEKCTQRYYSEDRLGQYAVKDLKKIKKLGFDLNHVLMIDDSPEKLERNYGNHIWIQPFEGDPGDNDLKLLQQYLLTLESVESVRKIEKRNWRSRVGAIGPPGQRSS